MIRRVMSAAVVGEQMNILRYGRTSRSGFTFRYDDRQYRIRPSVQMQHI